MPIDSVRPCPGCGRNDPERVGATGGFELERCRSCRTLFTARLPDVVDYDDYYHEGNLAVPEFVHARLRELAAGFDGYRASGRWLDVGCGAGTLLEAVRAGGWEAVGTEVSSGAAAQLQA